VGPTGQVVGIDNTERFIQSGKENHGSVPNLTLLHADLFDFDPEEKFDLIVAARVLQWLRNPLEALSRFRDLLKPQGQVSVLDYNHQDLEWQPAPPASMVHFYQTFLKWRAQAGMNNKIAEDLGDYFREQGFHDIEVLPADEVYKRGEPNFTAKLGIWSQVARSTQMVEEGYLAEEDRQQALAEYQDWIAQDATLMVMKLKTIPYLSPKG
jgi:trans-aconitate methyltransferase